MQLLYSNPVPNAEFCSLSLVLDTSSPQISCESIDGYIDLAIVTSPITTIAPTAVNDALSELHEMLVRLLGDNSATTKNVKDEKREEKVHNDEAKEEDGSKPQTNLNNNNENTSPSFMDACLEEERSFYNKSQIQTFHPTRSHSGIIMYYATIDDPIILQHILSLLSPTNKQIIETTKLITPLLAATICVGVTGMPHLYSVSPLMSSLTTRIRECKQILQMQQFWNDTSEHMQDIELALLSVLMEDEYLKTNEAVELEKGVCGQTDGSLLDGTTSQTSKSSKFFPVGQKNKKFRFTDRRRKKNKFKSTLDETKDSSSFGSTAIISSTASSSEMTRIFAEQMQILSIAENDMPIPPYQERMKRQQVEAKRKENMKQGNSPMRSSRRSGRFDSGTLSGSELTAFEYVPPGPRVDTTNINSLYTPTGQSVASTSEFTVSTAFTSDSSSVGSIPMLSGPSHDSSLQKNQIRRNKVMAASMAHQRSKAWNNVLPNPRASIRRSKLKTSDIIVKQSPSQIVSPLNSPALTSPPILRTSRNDSGKEESQSSARNFDPFEEMGQSKLDIDFMDPQIFSPGGFPADESFRADETTPINNATSKSDNSFWKESKQESNESTAIQAQGESSTVEPHTQVNIALNEDLACSYKMSKMVSCIVEGVVQVQVINSDKSPNIAPFMMRVKDPSSHINTLVENREYAENLSLDAQESDFDDNDSDNEQTQKFLITVSNSDNYFPVFKYKAAKQLRPIPIRVQSKVRFNEEKCRVALQISSNPSNEKTLTDLTIVMAVSPRLKGESLITQPPGGIFDAEKRNVIWYVAELGQGEKFQLQAQFDRGSFGDSDEEPSFPVLVRCQAMYTQFSNIDFAVSNSKHSQTLMVSKLSRRIRLSHKER